MRHLSYAFVKIFSGQHVEAPTTTDHDKTIVNHHYIKYYNDSYGYFLRNYSINFSICDFTVINFGQHSLSRSKLYGLWSPNVYAGHVQEVLSIAKQQVGETNWHNKLLWLTTFPLPDFLNFTTNDERRTSYNLKLYAQASMQIAKELDVAYLDIFSLANVLRDASADHAHYKTPVGHEIALLVLHKAYEMLSLN